MVDFTERMESLQSTMEQIAESISSIAFSIDEGSTGVGEAADNTQVLLSDMENIAHYMDDNQEIAASLKKETEVFQKL